MERDPLRFLRRSTPALHGAALLVLALGAPLLLVGLDLVRIAVDEIAPSQSLGPAAVPLLRLALPVPDRLGFGSVELWPGLRLEPEQHRLAVALALLLVPVGLALIRAIVALLAVRIETRALARLRGKILERMLAARPAARDEASAAALLAGNHALQEGGILGSGLLTPVAAGGVVALCLAYALAVSGWLALAALIGLAAAAGLQTLALRAGTVAVAARRREDGEVGASLTDLVRRLPALQAHGTAAYERDRLGRALAGQHRPVQAAAERFGLARAASAAALLWPVLCVLGAAAWLGPDIGATAGSIVASASAAALAALGVRRLVRWRDQLVQARRAFDQIARMAGSLMARERRGAAIALPGAGALVAQGVTAYEPASGTRLAAVDLSIPFPSHVALVGDGHTGARVFAALVGGQLAPTAGRLTFGGVDLAAADPADRAGRIAFAGGETILMPGSLRQNLLYGCLDAESPAAERRLMEAVRVAGLDGFTHARGLAGTFDPARNPKLAEALIESRAAVRAALAAEGLDRFVDPFDPSRYNRHAGLGENLLFGVPVGDTFRAENLASHPFVRAVLEANELTRPLTAMGLSIAGSMVEIFADLPDGHPLFERFSFFSSAERGLFEELAGRGGGHRRGPDAARDQERLIGLALRYNENRHRLGLLNEALEDKIVVARADFATMLPASLQPAIEFYRPDRLCSAAGIQDNLLFGRIAEDQAGAEEAVHRVVRQVLTERGLNDDVFRVGLDSRIDPRDDGLTQQEVAAIDLVRCLVRRADTVVVERALEGLPAQAAEALVERLRRALVGRGLVVVTPSLTRRMDAPPFDAVLRFERGALTSWEDRRAAAAPETLPIGA